MAAIWTETEPFDATTTEASADGAVSVDPAAAVILTYSVPAGSDPPDDSALSTGAAGIVRLLGYQQDSRP